MRPPPPLLQARSYHYLCLSAEALAGGAHGAPASMRPRLLGAHRSACLRSDEFGEAAHINLLLRSFVSTRDFASAAALLSKVRFPDGASTAQLVRFSFYAGRVQAVRLEYSDAAASLLQASRKTPSGSSPLRTAITAFLTIVQLLMGETPERRSLSAPALSPYLAVARAVRAGDVARFREALTLHAAQLELHGTIGLVRRLEANVIKTGLCRIVAAYATISFTDVAKRLNIASAADAEFLAAKAIRDGVLAANLDHSAGTLISRATPNVYLTKEPQEAFHRRIAFCLDVHHEAMKAMRFPPRAARADLESAEMKKSREEEEAFIAGGDLDDDDDDDGMDY